VINLYEFVVSADEIEKLTGIDFIRNLRMELKIKLEKSSDYKDWINQIEMESNFYRND
jgi:endonuclease G